MLRSNAKAGGSSVAGATTTNAATVAPPAVNNNHVTAVNQEPTNAVTDKAPSPSGGQLQMHGGRCACPVCGKTFRENWMVRRHMLTHGRAAVICPLCGKRFKRKDTLKAHCDKNHAGTGYADFIKQDQMKSSPSKGVNDIAPISANATSPAKVTKVPNSTNPKTSKSNDQTTDEPYGNGDAASNFDDVVPGFSEYSAMLAQTIEEFEGTDGCGTGGDTSGPAVFPGHVTDSSPVFPVAAEVGDNEDGATSGSRSLSSSPVKELVSTETDPTLLEAYGELGNYNPEKPQWLFGQRERFLTCITTWV